MTEKQAILRDLKVIAILNNKIDYSDHDNIGAVLELNPKSLFSTEYGQRYLDRIRAMYDGKEYEHTCILCGSPLDGANPVCDNCYKMITLGNAVAPKKPEKVVSYCGTGGHGLIFIFNPTNFEITGRYSLRKMGFADRIYITEKEADSVEINKVLFSTIQPHDYRLYAVSSAPRKYEFSNIWEMLY